MIESTRTILSQKVENAVTKTMYFGTYFDGKCSINIGDFPNQEARDLGINNCVESTLRFEVSGEEDDKVKEKLDQINALAYEILMLKTGGVEC